MQVSIIVAMSKGGVIGYQNRLPWHLPADLQHFKRLTTGHSVIMGHTTYASLPKKPLPNRRNIVLSHTVKSLPGCEVYDGFPVALAACGDEEEVFVIGGANIYVQALPLARRIYMTVVDDEPDAADAFFPPLNAAEWVEIKKEKHEGFSFVCLERKTSLLHR